MILSNISCEDFFWDLYPLLALNHSADEDPASADGILMALRAHRWNITHDIEQDLFELFNVFVTTWDEELTPLFGSRSYSLADIGDMSEVCCSFCAKSVFSCPYDDFHRSHPIVIAPKCSIRSRNWFVPGISIVRLVLVSWERSCIAEIVVSK